MVGPKAVEEDIRRDGSDLEAKVEVSYGKEETEREEVREESLHEIA